MREIVLRVPRDAVESVLDRLLPVVPGGVREAAQGDETELRMRGADLPPLADVARAAGRWRRRITEREVSDDWRERRLADYEPDVIGGRLVVRPDWAPASGQELELMLGEGAAFGAGTHPTTRACLELLLELTPSGAFADLGCGTGVLAILAAKLGWAPVVAVDVQAGSVAATLANAEANSVSVQAYAADLASEPPPAVDAIAANVPAPLHATVAAALGRPGPRTALLSGFGAADAAGVLAAYAARGLGKRRALERHGWTIALLETR